MNLQPERSVLRSLGRRRWTLIVGQVAEVNLNVRLHLTTSLLHFIIRSLDARDI